jgi:formamidopyrimidine-DNA glycosylase
VPELPDVEGFKRYLVRYADGRIVTGVKVHDRVLLRNRSPQTLARAVNRRKLVNARRHGKWLLVDAGESTLLFHFGMTGLFKWDDPPHPHDRIVLQFADGALAYRNMRRFGGVWLARGEREIAEVTGPLGPDAMEVGSADLEQMLHARRGGIKAALMDQRMLAGLGNLLVDEILWRSRIHPRRDARKLRPKDTAKVHRVMHDVLVESNRRARVPPLPGWLTGVRDTRDAKCPRCGTRLRKATVAGRTTCWCPRCQRRASA